MVYHGSVTNGRLVLEGSPVLPEGATVRVEVMDNQPVVVDDDPIYRIGELAVPTGIPDLAKNIDHYLYGHPRIDDDP